MRLESQSIESRLCAGRWHDEVGYAFLEREWSIREINIIRPLDRAAGDGGRVPDSRQGRFLGRPQNVSIMLYRRPLLAKSDVRADTGERRILVDQCCRLMGLAVGQLSAVGSSIAASQSDLSIMMKLRSSRSGRPKRLSP